VRELRQPVLFEGLMLRQGRPKAMLPTANCATCGKAIPSRWGAHYKNKAPKFCSRVCAGKANLPRRPKPEPLPPRSPRACIVCGASILSPFRRVCAGECERLRYRDYWIKRSTRDRSLVRVCASCGTSFLPEYGDMRRFFCSHACSQREGKHRRRSSKAAVQHEAIWRQRVFERDRWRCQLCGKRTIRRYIGTSHPRAPTLDHIRPVSKGGSHIYANLQCACFICNSRKGAKFVGQMRII
jgi:5-methylcytosine-specific restriction endonuclease McrA